MVLVVDKVAQSICRVLKPVSLLAGLVLPACVSQGERAGGSSIVPNTEGLPGSAVGADPISPASIVPSQTSGFLHSVKNTSLGAALVKGINRPLRDIEAAWNDPGILVDSATEGILDAAVRQARRSILQEIRNESDISRQLELGDLLLPRVGEYSGYRHRDVLTDRDGSYESWRPALDGLGQFSFGIVDDRADSVKFRLKTPSGSWAMRAITGECDFGDYCERIGASLTFSFDSANPTSLSISGDSTMVSFEVATVF